MYKIDTLLKEGRQLFHTKDLALLWGITNENTLYTAIKRYLAKGILIPVHKGFYSTVPLDKINPIELGIVSLHSYAYLSTESILLAHGVIFQSSAYITLISLKSKKFQLAGNFYYVRRLADKFLFNDAGLYKEKGVVKATLERAVADMLYYNPEYHFDNRKSIDWKKVQLIQKEVCYK